MKTSELIGPALDWAVAKCETNPHDVTCKNGVVRRQPVQYVFAPSTDWAEGGPIIEREKIDLDAYKADWEASMRGEAFVVSTGPTALVAAMRCYVISRLGDDIDVPQ